MGLITYKDESYAIRGAVIEVHSVMGCGFLEAVYQECLEIELQEQKIPFVSQKEIKLHYKKHLLKQKYVPDFICYDKIVLEIKSVKKLAPIDEAQILNYLKATKYKLGFLINFNSHPKVEIKRVVL